MWKPFRLVLATVLLASATGAEAADKTGVTDKTIKIGLFGPLSAPAGSAKKNVYGAAAIYKDINDKGGINGRKIELIIEDDACDAEKGIAAYTKLVEQDKVFLAHGAWCTKVALAVKPVAAKHPGVPYMVLGAASAEISSDLPEEPLSPRSDDRNRRQYDGRLCAFKTRREENSNYRSHRPMGHRLSYGDNRQT